MRVVLIKKIIRNNKQRQSGTYRLTMKQSIKKENNGVYSVVELGEIEDDGAVVLNDEAIEQQTDTADAVVAKNKTSQVKNVVWIVLALSIGFVVGRLTPNKSSKVVVGSPIDDMDVVSYNFLKTQKGKDTSEILQQLLTTQGAKPALLQLTTLMQEDAQIADSCHPLAHGLGQQALAVSNGFREALDAFQPLGLNDRDDNLLRTCNGAFMHGMIEHYIGQQSPTNSQEELNKAVAMVQTTLCANISPGEANLDNAWECQHGIGHGILQYYRRAAKRQMLENSLHVCAHATNVTTSYCQNGLWMDYFLNTAMVDHSFQQDPSRALQVCFDYANITSQAAIQDCIYYAPTAYLLHNPKDYNGAMDFCLQAFTAGYNQDAANQQEKNQDDNNLDDNSRLSICIGGVGGQAAKEHLQNFVAVEDICLSTAIPTPMLQTVCFEYALDYYSTSMGVRLVPETLCDDLQTFQPKCLKWAGIFT